MDSTGTCALMNDRLLLMLKSCCYTVTAWEIRANKASCQSPGGCWMGVGAGRGGGVGDEWTGRLCGGRT